MPRNVLSAPPVMPSSVFGPTDGWPRQRRKTRVSGRHHPRTQADKRGQRWARVVPWGVLSDKRDGDLCHMLEHKRDHPAHLPLSHISGLMSRGMFAS